MCWRGSLAGDRIRHSLSQKRARVVDCGGAGFRLRRSFHGATGGSFAESDADLALKVRCVETVENDKTSERD